MSIKATIKDIFQVGLANGGQEITKEEKIKLMDQALDDSMGRPRGLLITANFSNSGKRINNRVYAPIAQRDSLSMWTSPTGLPLLRNHDTESEPLGRVQSVEVVSYEDAIKGYFRDQREMTMFMQDMYSEDPRRIQAAMNNRSLLSNRQWPGVAELRGKIRVGDKDAIEKFLDQRYLTLSASATTSMIMCGTCGANWAMGDMCGHHPGDAVEDGPGYNTIIAMDYMPREISVVNVPANKTSMVHSMEMVDSEGNDILSNLRKENKKLWSFTECTVCDNSNVEIAEDSYHCEKCKKSPESCSCDQQMTQDMCGKCNSPMGECSCNHDAETEAGEKYDHTLTLSEPQMSELHESGEVFIEQTGDEGEKMTIRVVYPKAKMEQEGGVQRTEDAEKKFKVPAGAKGNAKKVLEWKEKHGSEVKGMTPVGWARARQLANQSEIPLSTVKRMAAFNRHRKNAEIDPKFKDTPWKDRGYVAWLGWGGTTGVDWAIKISQANDSAIEDFDGDEWYADLVEDKRSSPKGRGAKTPAEPSERIKGSKKNKEGSAAKGSSKITVGPSAEKALKEKVEKHNAKHGDKKGKKVTLGMLKAVWRRGAGAFSQTHRPSMSRAGWAMARVNAFLKLVVSGSPANKNYNTDNDLLPAGHPKKSNSDSLETSAPMVADGDCGCGCGDCGDVVSDEQIDWAALDTMLDMEMGDKMLTTKQRNALPDEAFCGPDRSFPVPDCAHYTAALRMLGLSKLDESGKQRVKSCVMRKGKSLGCTKAEDSEANMSEEILNLIDSIVLHKLSEGTQGDIALSSLEDGDFLYEGRKIPVADKHQVESVMNIISDIKLDDELKNMLTERLTVRLEALQDSETKDMEELIARFKDLGLDDAQARAAAVVHYIKTAELSDEERQALFKPQVETVEDEQIKEDYKQLLSDFEAVKKELAELKAEATPAEEPVVVAEDSAEQTEETAEVVETETVVEDAAQPEAEAQVEEAPVAEEVVEATEQPAELNDSVVEVKAEEPEVVVADKIENPSGALTDAVNNDSQVAELTAYQSAKVQQYISIRDSQSEENAQKYISMLKRLGRLPFDFDVKPHLK